MKLTRRKVLVLGSTVAIATCTGVRGFWYSGTEAYAGLAQLSPRAGFILGAIVDAMLPPLPRSTADLVGHVRTIDTFLGQVPQGDRAELVGGIYGIEHATLPWGGHLSRFTGLDRAGRGDVLQSWRVSRIAKCRLCYRSFKALVFLAYYRDQAAFAPIHYGGPVLPGGTAEARVRYAALAAPPGNPTGMIFSAEHLHGDTRLDCDVCVIGSGAGGAPVAAECSARGLKVIVLEAGSYWRPEHFSQVEVEMFPRLYHDAAGRTTVDKSIHVHQGKGVGGSTLHNINLCARVPAQILAAWRAEHGLSALPPATLDALYAEVEARLSVSQLGPSQLNGNNSVFARGVAALGYKGGYLHHNRVGCAGSGFCELGCPFDAKQNALKIYLTDAVKAGAQVLADTWALSIEHSGRQASRVIAQVRDPITHAALGSVTVGAKVICVSASATGTPALLQRSRVPDPHRLVGARLFLHPGAAVAGVFDTTIAGWQGVPQSYECTQFLDFATGSQQRVWIVPTFAHPGGVSAVLSGFGAEHAAAMADYDQTAAVSAMVHDEHPGRVRAGDGLAVDIDYTLHPSDAAQLALGLRESGRILLAAGARKVIVPLARPLELTSMADLDRVLGGLEIRAQDTDLTAVHPMGSVWMGDDQTKAPVDSTGRYHQLDNLYVADTSLYPGSIGVPPQITAYALGTHVGRQIARSLA